MTTTTTPTVRRYPLVALATAEFRQFRRNKTLLIMGTVFPLCLPVVTFFVSKKNTATVAAATIEMFALLTLLFVQYYSVLSMITTRRGEGVLKRLRTGEAADWQILAAPAVSGVVLTLAGTAVMTTIVYGSGAPAPVNPLALAAALAGGIIVFSLLALATSAVTKNAEAAQITSLPVMVLAMVGSVSTRAVLPNQVADIVSWTPFAATSDLIALGAAGRPATESDIRLDFAGTFAECGQPLATLALWTVLALALIYRSFRWEDRA